MSDAIRSALSGLNASVTRINTAAANIVNASSPEKILSTGGENSAPKPAVDIVSETLAIRTAQVIYEASARIVRAVEDNQKKLIDTVA